MRDAILKAADHLERHPKAFRFMENRIPSSTDEGQTGCYLGWIGHFAGVKNSTGGKDYESTGCNGVALKLGYVTDYDGEGSAFTQALRGVTQWGIDRDKAGRNLRRFADKCYPEPKEAPELTKLKAELERTRAPSWWPPSWFTKRAATAEHNTVS